MPALLINLFGMLLPMLARLGIGAVVGGVVYTFLASTIVPFINNTISQLLSQSNQLLNLV